MTVRHDTIVAPSPFTQRMAYACTQAEIRDVYLDGIEGVLDARAHGLYELDPEGGSPLECTARAPGDFLEEYELYGRDDDPVLRSARERGAPVDDTRATTEAEWRGSGAFNALSRAGFVHSLEAPLLIGEHLVGTLNFARAPDDRPFSRRDLSRAGMASHQLSAAMYRAMRFEAAGERSALLAEVVDALERALVITSMDGEFLYANLAAERPVSGAETSIADAARPALVRALAQLRRDSLESASFSERLPEGAAEGEALRATVRSVRLGEGLDAVLSFLAIEPDGDRHLRPGVSRLSPREQDIAEFVARGFTTRQMARRLFISENTVKQHLKRMFQKMNVRSRAQLIECLWNPVEEPG